MRLRIAIALPGVLVVAYGAWRILTLPQHSDVLWLAVWLAVSVAVHDGVLVPLTLLVGVVLARVVAPRARRYLQGGLVAGALVTVVALPLIDKRGSVPAVKALLRQDYAAHLAFLLGLVAAGAALAYVLRVRRDQAALRQAALAGDRDEHDRYDDSPYHYPWPPDDEPS